MSAYIERVKQDIKKLEILSQESGGKVRLLAVNDSPARIIEVELDYITAPSTAYPRKVQRPTRLSTRWVIACRKHWNSWTNWHRNMRLLAAYRNSYASHPAVLSGNQSVYAGS